MSTSALVPCRHLRYSVLRRSITLRETVVGVREGKGNERRVCGIEGIMKRKRKSGEEHGRAVESDAEDSA
jgi:hypothetical protein